MIQHGRCTVLTDSEAPLFSIVICAHNRRTYLTEAVRSALEQDFPREKFEIILVKNFHDEPIDKLAAENGISTIFTEEGPLSRKMVEGIRESRAEYICFLEDDDVFEPNKLKRIESFIKSLEKLSFYHNSHSTINERGEETETEISNTADKTLIFTGMKEILDGMRSMLRTRADWYGSMMCVRRGAILPYADVMWNATGSADKSIFYLSLLDGGSAVIDAARTTKYRFHQSHTTVVAEYNEFYNRKRQFFEKSYRSSKLLLDSCKGTFLEPVLSCAATHEYILHSFVNANEKAEIFRLFPVVLRCIVSQRMWPVLFWYVLLTLKKVAGRASMKLYYIISTSFSLKSMV